MEIQRRVKVSDLSRVFDDAVERMMFDDTVSDEWKIRFFAKCFESVHGFGWRNYDETKYWGNELVKQAYKKFKEDLTK